MLRLRRNAGRCVTPSGVRRPVSGGFIDCWLMERFMAPEAEIVYGVAEEVSRRASQAKPILGYNTAALACV